MVGGSQRLLSLNPTTVMVVLLLGLWLLLGCDKNLVQQSIHIFFHFENFFFSCPIFDFSSFFNIVSLSGGCGQFENHCV